MYKTKLFGKGLILFQIGAGELVVFKGYGNMVLNRRGYRLADNFGCNREIFMMPVDQYCDFNF